MEVSNPTNFFTGAIDDVAFYDNAFDSTQAAALFENESTENPVPASSALTLFAVTLITLLRRRSNLSNLDTHLAGRSGAA